MKNRWRLDDAAASPRTAAVAAAMALTVVEPVGRGIGSAAVAIAVQSVLPLVVRAK